MSAFYLLFRVILKLHLATFPFLSLAVYVISYKPGTANLSPEGLLDLISGASPELSVAVALCQLILISCTVASSTEISLGQKVKTGGSVSSKMRITSQNIT